ncbi:MAG TPA: hypothetical protein VGF29_04080 [Hyphomicrobiaceae bacterium]|jgi:hypothetical protein
MSYAETLVTEINALLDRLADEGQQWRPALITNAICAAHLPGLSKKSTHALFWRHCGYAEVREQVRECISRRTNPTAAGTDDEAPRLPGFEHARAYYSIKRGNEIIGVHILHLTAREFDEKIAWLRKSAKTENAHADELEKIKQLIHFRGGEAAA